MGFHKIEEFETVMKGKKVMRERIILPHAVAGLVVDEEGKMVFVKQFRPCLGVDTIEIPAGILDMEGLTPYETLIVELEEECSIHHNNIVKVAYPKPLYTYHTVSGSSDASTTIYVVNLRVTLEKYYSVDDADVDSVVAMDSKEVNSNLRAGNFRDAKTLLAVNNYLLRDMLGEL